VLGALPSSLDLPKKPEQQSKWRELRCFSR
jgi:hypothetical protein